MRHIYIRSILALIWLVAAFVCGISGNMETCGLYLVIGIAFLFFAYTAWKSEQDKKGGK